MPLSHTYHSWNIFCAFSSLKIKPSHVDKFNVMVVGGIQRLNYHFHRQSIWYTWDCCDGNLSKTRWWFMNDDCQPVITWITTNRRRCNTDIVAGDCRQCPDHHNYWCGHRDTNIRGDICAQFAAKSSSWQQGHRRRSNRPAQRCLQGMFCSYGRDLPLCTYHSPFTIPHSPAINPTIPHPSLAPTFLKGFRTINVRIIFS